MSIAPHAERAASERADRLRRVGLRATGPRLAILEALERDHTHPTPERVLATVREHAPTLSLSTVYQTLEAFVRAGLCRRVAGADGRLRVDGTPHDHDHAVCRDCGGIFDVARPESGPGVSGDRLPGGSTLIGVRLEYEILCPRCA